MKRVLPIAIAVLLLALPAYASAHKVHKSAQHPTSNPTALAVAAAENYWGRQPCGGHLVLKATAILPPEISETPSDLAASELGSISAWAEWETPVGPNDIEEPPSTYTRCTITLDSEVWPNWQGMDDNYQEYCDVMTREVGHLFGHGDESTDMASIEYPLIGSENFDSVPQCRSFVLYYGREVFRSEAPETPGEAACEVRRREAAVRQGKTEWPSCGP